MPWIVPRLTDIEMSLLACTGPKALEMPFSSMAAASVMSDVPEWVGCGTGRGSSRTAARALSGIRGSLHLHGAGAVVAEVVDNDLAANDLGFGLFHGGDHLGRDQPFVVLVDRVADAFLGKTEDMDAGFDLGASDEGVIDGHVHALEHRGQDRTGVQVVLVRVHADGVDAFICCDLQNAEAGAAGGRIDDVGALGDLTARQL